MREEIWKDIPGFEGEYQASTLGRIQSIVRTKAVTNPTGRRGYVRNHKSVILHVMKDRDKFNYVTLYVEGERIKGMVHRLVAVTFLDNPNGYRYVKFKDGDRNNMSVSNLEWTDGKRRN